MPELYLLSNVNLFLQDFTLDLFFRVQWHDPRLVYDEVEEDLIINNKIIHKFWTPDIYFPNEKDARFHEVTVPNRQLVVSADGNCTYNLRFYTLE